MKKIFLILVFYLSFSNIAFAALPDYITKNTFTNICRNASCPQNLNSKYITTYYHKQFHKALSLSVNKSGGKYTIKHVSWSYQYPSAIEAKSSSLRACRKKASNCEIFLVNNSYVNQVLYDKLTKRYSSSNKIPNNAYASSSADKGWKCLSNYYQKNNYCIKLPTNASAFGSGNGFFCKTGFKKSGLKCIRKLEIPANAYASNSADKGWKCRSNYYQNKNYCLKLPTNASAYGSGDGYFCKSGYEKIANKCVRKLKIPANAYASSDGSWKCNSGYYKNNKFCSRLPSNAVAYNISDGFFCKTGFKKSGLKCIRKLEIPANAYASNSADKGWKCRSNYYQNKNYCLKLPTNASAYGSGDGYFCKSGYNKTGSRCLPKYNEEDAYKNAKLAYQKQDYQAAFKEFTILANKGNEKAQNYIGYMYNRGYGVAKNYVLAAKWYRKASNQGYAVAQANLGYLYEFGQGVPKDLKQAVNWYRKAANKGRCSEPKPI